MKSLFFLILISFSFSAQAQIVTSSFDPTVMSFNPAAAANRYFGGFYTKYDKKKLEAAGTEIGDIPDQGLYNLNADWSVEDEIDSFKFLYSNVTNKYKIIPEVLIYQQSLSTIYHRTDNTGTDQPSSVEVDSDIKMGQFNLAHTFMERFELGVHFGMASVEQVHDLTLAINGNTVIEDTVADTDIMGFGGGFNYKLPMNFYLGGFYMQYDLAQTFSGTRNFGTGSEPVNEAADFKIKAIGYGLAYQFGKREGKSLKIEFSERRTDSEISTLQKGLRRTLSAEGMTEKYYAGLSVFQSKGDNVNLQDIVETLISERINSNESTIGFGVSAGFRTTNGHSFGGSASYSKADIPSRISFLNEDRFDSEVKLISFSLSYAFIQF